LDVKSVGQAGARDEETLTASGSQTGGTAWLSALQGTLAGLQVPLLVAPMTGVSNWELTAAAINAGAAASFPTHNCLDSAEVGDWLTKISTAAGPAAAVMPNLVVHRTNARLRDDLDVLIAHQVPAVITSVGSPEAVIKPLHDAGIAVLSDVASLRHAERAIAAGVDGLVLLCAGAGGQTGWANPLAFVRAVRGFWDGLVVMAGGIIDGAGLLAAIVAGSDLGYMGTRFIATTESAAAAPYREAVVRARLDDIETTTALTGLATNMIKTLATSGVAVTEYDAAVLPDLDGATGNTEFFSAGHGVSAITSVADASAVVEQISEEFRHAARTATARIMHAANPSDLLSQ